MVLVGGWLVALISVRDLQNYKSPSLTIEIDVLIAPDSGDST